MRSFHQGILLIFVESEENLCQSDMSLWLMTPSPPD